MTHLQKIQHLENYLSQSDGSFADGFKTDILFYFNNDFTENNQDFHFLNAINTTLEIEQKIDFILSQFVLKFNPESETENDFIHYYLGS
jgi:hypothetical protein